MHELNKAMHDIKGRMDTEYEKTEKETKNEAAKSPLEGKITDDKSESEDKGRV
jgi:hypothetical protein